MTNEQRQKGQPLQYSDKLLKLDSDALILARIIINHEQGDDNVFVFRPVELVFDKFGGSHMHPWIPESSDEFFFIPSNKIVNVSTPRPEFMKVYHENFLAQPQQRPIDPTTGEQIPEVLH